ncbi:MAG: metallophosphoesterase [Pseudomonadota bacterium]
MDISRRSIVFGGLALAGGLYVVKRGVRYPTLSLESAPIPDHYSDSEWSFKFDDCFRTDTDSLAIRAFAPEPRIKIVAKESGTLKFEMLNLSPECELESSSVEVDEVINGTRRSLNLRLTAGEKIDLNWHLPAWQGYTFASIGDSGGADELAWCLRRAHELNAKFLLHLGDFNYQAGDYRNAVDLFNNSPIPCYISIGNHDFHEDGLIYNQFTSQLGPLNNTFQIGATKFINLDTAANTWPRSGAQRGQLIRQIEESKKTYQHSVAFTHRPLHDPTEESSHDIGSETERDWLISALKSLNTHTLLSGHIHIFDRSEFNGIDNIIVGQGLGHQDLITADTGYSKMALGQVSADGSVEFEFEGLNMPMEMHCHPRVQPVKDSLMETERADLMRQIASACELT